MINAITHSSIYVLDQDEALDFYVGKLGLEVATDADMGIMRWLTVHVAGSPGRELLLEKPGPPALDDETARQVSELVAKSAMPVVIFTTPDCRATYDELVAQGVQFTQPPIERFYGTDCALRDPFGNPLRITQPTTEPYEVPAPGALD
jgi:catechol 2,3-dioxygenase-like lactoylglutathione lyase family enzyme